MAVNSTDFKTFAGNVAANVISQALYAVSGFRSVGFAAGAALSAQLNKTWRQASLMMSSLAEFCFEELGENVVDDGDAGVPAIVSQIRRAIQHTGRIRLRADTTFYVSNSGSNSNDGLTPGTPWETIQYAYDKLATDYDLGGFQATVQLANGTYFPLIATIQPLSGSIKILGDTGTPTNVAIDGNSANLSAIQVSIGALVIIQGCLLSGGGGSIGKGCCIHAATTGSIVSVADCVMGSAAVAHVQAIAGASILISGSYSLNGDAPLHWALGTNAQLNTTSGVTITVPALNFSSAFVGCSQNSTVFSSQSNVTFNLTGVVTGQRYIAFSNGVIDTVGGPANFFPGDVAGSTSAGGQYV